ncbi:hypothetical protein AUJ67_08150 [Candidatus Desantisbacteria bacterium CG1_02_49_89]|nr:MAG: hypothetical protein AUJ67_08150 [Candidatus Desantisbacteria bacterium CG1_02_49_89]
MKRANAGPKLLLLFAFILLLSTASLAADSFTLPMNIIDVGPRAQGFSGAFTGIADDASAFYWNPAGYGFFERYGISASHSSGLSYWGGYVTYSHPLGALTVIRSASGLSWDGIDGKGTTDLFIFTQAVPLGDIFSVGFNLKGLSQNNGESVGYGCDLGALLRTQYFRLGFTAQDLVSSVGKMKSNPLYRIGVGIGPFSTVMIGAQVDLIDLSAFQAGMFLPQIRTGIEGWLAEERFGLRVGYSILPLNVFWSSVPNNQTCSLGFSIKLQYFVLDYAYTIPLEGSVTENHNIALSFMWGKTKAEIAAEEKEKVEAEAKTRKAEELLKLASFSETLARKKEQLQSVEREKMSKDKLVQVLDAENKQLRADSVTMTHELDIAKLDLAKVNADSVALRAELLKTRSELEILQAQIKKGELGMLSEQEKAAQLEEKLKQIKAYANVDPDLKMDIGKNLAKGIYMKDTQEGLLIRFGRDTYFKGRTMASATYKALDTIANALIKHQGHSLNINGYTDITGSKKANVSISEAVAGAVKEYMISKGVPEDKVFSNGYGPDNPIAPNTSKSGRSQNRRVELIIYKQ